ncbi:hypothetical protein OPQ81_011178 [Rhizoctonia solani]|nr:hypothetical protein OPQ81_011178 [Rhizoctonia solani]
MSHAPDLNHHDQPDSLSRFMNLGMDHLTRFQRLGSLDDIEKAIEYMSLALALSRDDHPGLPNLLISLGVCFSDRFRRLGELGDLDNVIKYQSRAIVLTPNNDPHLPRRLVNLGAAYVDRFQRLNELGDINKAVENLSTALTLASEDSPDSPLLLALTNLGVALSDRFERMGDLKDLERAIECGSRALALAPDDHPYLPLLVTNLGVSYRDRFTRLGELSDLEKVIQFNSRSISLTPKGHPSLPGLLMRLGLSHGDRFKRLNELCDLEKAIEAKSRALALTPDGHSDLASRLISLGVSYSDRFKRLGDPDDLNKAIEYEYRAISLTADDHPRLPSRLISLGVSYGDRFKRLGEIEDLEKAIDCKSRATALTPNDHPDLPSRLVSLGVSYRSRFERLGELDDLQKSIERISRALTLIPDNHPGLPSCLMALGASHGERFNRLYELGDLERAIECNSSALSLTLDNHPDLPYRLVNLGLSYGDRFRHLGDLGDLEKSIDCVSRSLSLTPDGHPALSSRLIYLGLSFSDRFQRLGRLDDITTAIVCARRALTLIPNEHPDLPKRYHSLARFQFLHSQHADDISLMQSSLHSYRSASQSLIGVPKHKFEAALEWATSASEHNSLEPIEAYQTTINLLPQFIWLGATIHQRYQDLDTAKGLAASAAHTAILSSEYSLALEWLEHARCVVWSQYLMLSSPLNGLYSSHPDLANNLKTVASKLRHCGSQSRVFSSEAISPENIAQQHRRLAREYNDLLSKVRKITGFEDFLKPTKANRLIHAARNGPVIVINCHKDNCHALLILPGQDNVSHIPLPGFTLEKAQRARTEIEMLVRSNRLGERGKRRPVLEMEDDFADMLAILWCNVVKPILDFLGYTNEIPKGRLPHITWCPTGFMSFLPLHAAGNYDQPGSRVFDYVVSSYTPTLTALLASTPSVLRPDSRVLLISQEATPGHSPLPGTAQELGYIQSRVKSTAQCTQLMNEQATTTAVLDAMEHHDWVHLACHAHQNVEDATKSGFFLHDGTLDLAAINQRSFKNKGLAFLSACQTAKGDKELPDEAVHLASGMLMAGYTSVIATMWSVNDGDAPLVADRVYAQLMKDRKVGNGEAGKALHNAVAELREKVGEKEFGRWVPFIHIGS